MEKQDNKKIGDRGEEMAANFLVNTGYAILEKKYRNRMGEIDIVARFGNILAFVEVKTRRTDKFGRPAAAVDFRKKQKIISVAKYYIQVKGMEGCHPRFDVIEVMGVGGTWNINHIKGAFEAC